MVATTKVRGADLIVQALRESGVRYLFGITGDTVLDVLDALYDTDLEYITTHQERVAVAMADAYARVSGTMGAVLLHVGPGAAAGVIGVMDAMKDGTPLLVLTGNLHRAKLGWDSWHEFDVMQVYRGITKWSRQLKDVREVPGVLREAVHQAVAARCGPAHVDMPADILKTVLSGEGAPQRILHGRIASTPWPDAGAVAEAAGLIAQARRPVLLCGEGATACEASDAIVALAEYLHAPVVTSEGGRGIVPEDHPLSLALGGHQGNSTANRAIREADLIVGLGSRYGNMLTINDALITGDSRLLQVETSADDIRGRLRQDLAVVGDVRIFAEQVREALVGEGGGAVDRDWTDDLARARGQELERYFSTDLDASPVKPQRIIRDVTDCLPRDGVVVVGAGYHQQWANKVPVRAPRSYLQASHSGSMGWALGAAIGAKLARPDRKVIAVIGDGDFASVAPDIETAVRCRQSIVYVVMNDGGYGALRVFQQNFYRGRCVGNDFPNPDFGKLAELYGAAGVQVTRGPDVRPAIEAALAREGVPTVVDVLTDYQEPYYRASEFSLFHQFADI